MTNRFFALVGVAALVVACGSPAATPGPTSGPTPSTVATGQPSSSPPSPSPAAASASPGPKFRVVGSAPVVRRTVVPDTSSILAAAIVRDTWYHAYVVGFSSDPTDHRLYHLTSTDAVTWTLESPKPIEIEGVDLSHPGPIPTSVFNEGEAWAMYFSGIAAPARLGFDIWRATAPGPNGPWTADPDPILQRGPAGAWDSMAVDAPAVVPTADGHLMLYQGGVAARPEAGWIGLATSGGSAWTKHDDPGTTDAERGESDPVLSPGLCGGFDARAAQWPRLMVDGERLVLVYAGYAGALSSRPGVGLAESRDDGRTWLCLSEESALDPTGLPAGLGVHVVAAFERDGKPALLVEWLAGNGSDIWLAEMEYGLP